MSWVRVALLVAFSINGWWNVPISVEIKVLRFSIRVPTPLAILVKLVPVGIVGVGEGVVMALFSRLLRPSDPASLSSTSCISLVAVVFVPRMVPSVSFVVARCPRVLARVLSRVRTRRIVLPVLLVRPGAVVHSLLFTRLWI